MRLRLTSQCLLLVAGALSLCAPAAGADSLEEAAATGSIAARIAAAEPGQTVTIGPGVYRERLRIDKPLKLVGIGRPAPIIDGGGSGDIIEVTSPDVEIQGLLLRGTGMDLDKENCAIRVLAPRVRILNNVLEDVLFGIDLKSAPDSVIKGNRIGGKQLDIARRGDGIRLWRADRSTIEDNTIHDGRDAILWYSTGVTIRGNRSLRCRYGFHLMYSDSVLLEDNLLQENSVGVYFMYSKELTLRNNRLIRNRGPSGYGLGLKETDLYTVEGNTFVGNRVGVYIDGSPFTHTRPGVFKGNTIACNDVGLTLLPAVRGNQFSANNMVDNIEQVSIAGRGELRGNDFSVDERGNFWSDYTGYDLDHDGVGDFEYASVRLFEGMIDREPKLRLLLFSPAQQAIEFVGRALPAVRPEPKFSDEWPLMRPVSVVKTEAAAPPDRLRLAMAGMGLVVVAMGVVVAGLGWRAPLRRCALTAQGAST